MHGVKCNVKKYNCDDQELILDKKILKQPYITDNGNQDFPDIFLPNTDHQTRTHETHKKSYSMHGIYNTVQTYTVYIYPQPHTQTHGNTGE